jgi:hypothetical protein
MIVPVIRGAMLGVVGFAVAVFLKERAQKEATLMVGLLLKCVI